MRIHNSLRNNFFGLILVLAFVLPNMVFAKYDVKGDTTNNINNYENGAGYYFDSKAGYYKDTNPAQANLTLFNSDQTRKKLTGVELSGLKSKLEAAGLEDVKMNSLTTDNVYVINTGEETIFVYDPKIEAGNPNNANDQLIIGMATKDARLYVPKKALLKESAEANEAFNDIDTDRRLPSGSTLARKNAAPLLAQQRVEAQEVYDQALANKNAAQAALDSYQGSDAVRRAELENDVREANLAEQNAARAANTIGYNQAVLQQQQLNSAQPLTDPTSCASTWDNPAAPISTFYCVATMISKITNVILNFVSFIAYIVGKLFDYSLELSINSAQFFKQLGVVEVTWSFIRDILNMTFIFILLWTAVQILIGNEAKYNAKQVLTKVIIVAILINFSLFAAKLMVDGSNIVSLKMYEAMKSNTESADATISERIMNTVGLSTLYNISEIFNENKTKAPSSCANDPGALITVSIMGSIFLIILCLALGLAAILFLVRLVNIIFLFIKSPLWVWGYVLPGNKFVSKQKDEWWAQMKHVLIFPIAYLFWMLVAVIIFDSLGQVKNDPSSPGGLLGLICGSPAQQAAIQAGTQAPSMAGSAISLVAIFCIVIIFMMKAIQYGVEHAVGPSGSVGGDFSKKWAGRFSTAQAVMTKGLAKKAGKIAKGASIGATKVPLRAVTGLAGGVHSFRKNEGFWKGANDGFSNPGINLKEMAGDVARNQALSGGVRGALGEVTGLNKVAAALAKKYEDPVNELGETRKKADERRAKSTADYQANLNAAIDKKYKIPTQEEWEKKNGKIVTDAQADQFEKHMMDIIEKRADALLGKGVIKNKDEKDPTKSHLEVLKGKALKREDVIDKTTGAVIGKKVKVSETAVHNSMLTALDYHTTGAGKEVQSITSGKTKLERYRNIKAQARIKAIKTGVEKTKSEGLKKDAAKKQIEVLEKTIEKMQKVQEATKKDELQRLINTGMLYTGDGDNEKTIVKLNKAIDDMIHNSDPTKAAALKAKAETHAKAHQDYLEKHNELLVKKQNELVRKLKEKEEADKK